MTKLIVFIVVYLPILVYGQSYHPAAGQLGSTAIHKDSNVFVGWASGIELKRGFLNIADTSYQLSGSNKASYGNPNEALGPAEGMPGNVVSLGDGGEAVLTFDHPIIDGPGYDFAIFENSFSDTYLELAHVSVSSDGINYVEFESVSETSLLNQVGPFASLDPTYLHNLAGKYRAGYGVPFDLNELATHPFLDLQNIQFIKIKDCVGSIDPSFGTEDGYGNLINDPFPTPFESGGFDLDAVGVINWQETTELEEHSKLNFKLYPNPSNGNFTLEETSNEEVEFFIYDQTGRIYLQDKFKSSNTHISLSLAPGVYWLRVQKSNLTKTEKIIIQ